MVQRYTDLDGNTITLPTGYGGTVLDANPPAPAWAVPDPTPEPQPQPAPRILTKLEYLRLFTQQERIAIRTAADQTPELFDYLEMLKLAEDINLDDPDTIGAVTLLELAGLIAPGRASEILHA